MEFVIHIVTTTVILLVVSRLLAGFEISSLFTALLTAVILAVLHALLAPLAASLGRALGEMLSQSTLAYPLKIVLIIVVMLVVNAVILKVAAAFGPGFRIDNFGTAIVAAALMVVCNLLIGEAFEFLQSYSGGIEEAAPGPR